MRLNLAKYFNTYIYNELIEETARLRELIFGMLESLLGAFYRILKATLLKFQNNYEKCLYIFNNTPNDCLA